MGQTTRYVATTGSDVDGDGSAGNPWLTISNGVFQAAAGDTLLVATGRYEVAARILINKQLNVFSWNAAAGGGADREQTIVDGNFVCSPLYLDHPEALFAGFTITEGNALRGFQDNFGGGVLLARGTLSNCVVAGNVASHWGGGIYMHLNANALVTDCLVRDNTTTNFTSWGRGGGIYIRDGGGTVMRSQILSNSCFASGGGVHVLSSAVISNCLVASNVATSTGGAAGGGLNIAGTNVVVANCIVSNNTSALIGGGICVEVNGFAEVRDCTMVANWARSRGGGFQSYNTSATGGAIVSNCVIAENRVYEPNGCGAGLADGYVNRASSGTLSVVQTRISNNGGTTNIRFGGGAWIYTFGTAIFDRCEVVGNTTVATSPNSHQGAGIYISTNCATVVMQNCLIAGNRIEADSGSGGGIFFGNAHSTIACPGPLAVTLQSCTIVDNAVMRDWGGIYVTNLTGLSIWNTIVVSNRADRLYPDLQDDAQSIAPFSFSCSPALTNSENGNITNLPAFMDYSSGDYRLATDSPGIQAGTNQLWMTGAPDLAGRPRLDRFVRRTDMGCYEYIPSGVLFNLR